jgi:hypothetical protein
MILTPKCLYSIPMTLPLILIEEHSNRRVANPKRCGTTEHLRNTLCREIARVINKIIEQNCDLYQGFVTRESSITKICDSKGSIAESMQKNGIAGSELDLEGEKYDAKGAFGKRSGD